MVARKLHAHRRFGFISCLLEFKVARKYDANQRFGLISLLLERNKVHFMFKYTILVASKVSLTHKEGLEMAYFVINYVKVLTNASFNAC